MDTTNENNPIWAEIYLDTIIHNFQAVRSLIKPKTKIMAVVKANAYGHGAVTVAQTFASAGAEAFGVARFCEGMALRKAGLKQPILVFGYTPPTATEYLIINNLTQTVFSQPYAFLLNNQAQALGSQIKVHVKIDTGMGRLGLVSDRIKSNGNQHKVDKGSIFDAIYGIAKLANLGIEGIYTHFAASDSTDKTSAHLQVARFQEITSHLEANGLHIPIKHAANSGAIIDLPEAHFDMVRPGIMLYGLYPSDEVSHNKIDLQPSMQLKARIAQVKSVPKGFKVSYGQTFTAPQDTRIATIPIGYADGYDRRLSSSGVMLVRGQRAPVIGRVCMDQTMLDVGHINGVRAGDEAVILGQQGESALTAEAMAKQLGTINYEIVSTVMDRVPRIFTRQFVKQDKEVGPRMAE